MTAEPYTPQVGHRVRRTHVVEGVVTETSRHVVAIPPHGWFLTKTSAVTWERLPDPEPIWSDRDAVQDAHGRVFIYSPHGGFIWTSHTGSRWSDDELTRPLTRLVPEVKA